MDYLEIMFFFHMKLENEKKQMVEFIFSKIHESKGSNAKSSKAAYTFMRLAGVSRQIGSDCISFQPPFQTWCERMDQHTLL